jgi:aminopeptidase N
VALAAALLGALLLSAAPAPGVPAASSFPIGDRIYPMLGQAGLDVRHYDLDLTVARPGTLELRGEVTLTLAATRPLAAIALDYLGPAVQEVRWNGAAQAFTLDRAAGKLRVVPPAPLRPGETARLSVRYSGLAVQTPDPPLLTGWQAVPGAGGVGGANYSLSEPVGTRGFMPVNDHPSDPATFTVRITVSAGYTAAASGVETGVVSGRAGRTFTFEQAVPIPVYALAIHVNRFMRVDSAPVPVGVGGAAVVRRDYFPAGLLPRVAESVRAPYRRTGEMLEVLAGWFGPFPFAAHGSAIVESPVPALETATLNTMPVRSSSERVLVHETAHQWFGDRVVLADWSDVWLSEGFATYAELLWAQAQGQDGGEVAAGWYARLQGRPTRPLAATSAEELFDQTAYLRGALALHALRTEVGDMAFRGWLRSYVAAFSGRPASTAGLLALTRRELGVRAESTLRLWAELPTLPPLPAPPS